MRIFKARIAVLASTALAATSAAHAQDNPQPAPAPAPPQGVELVRRSLGDGDYMVWSPAAAVAPAPFNVVARADYDPIRARVFPPELIMENAAAIDLTAAQRDAIIGFAEQSQARTTRLQLEMTGARADLVAALDAEDSDTDQILEALESVLENEHQMKLENFTMLLRIRDALSAEQQEQLRQAAGPAFGLTATRVVTPLLDPIGQGVQGIQGVQPGGQARPVIIAPGQP